MYSIGEVAKRTGVSAPTIRTWENRYGAVAPGRSASGHRRYTADAVVRLELLKTLVDAGERIGRVAALPLPALRAEVAALGRTGDASDDPAEVIAAALDALRALDRDAFRSTLDQASVLWGQVGMLDLFLRPLMTQIGDRCATGDMRMIHEHLAAAETRGFLDAVMGAYPAAPGAPALVVGTPAWQHHELGALVVAASARASGWRALFLGPNLPAAELAAAAIQTDARAIALSIAFVDDTARMTEELRRLRRLVPDGVDLLVGGLALTELADTLAEVGALPLGSLGELRDVLAHLRRHSRPAGSPAA